VLILNTLRAAERSKTANPIVSVANRRLSPKTGLKAKNGNQPIGVSKRGKILAIPFDALKQKFG
jgi:hypothetical protein